MEQTAILFPGQGSQSVGMLADYYHEFASFRQALEEASDVLKYDVFSVIETGPEDKLAETQFTQPLILSVSVALWRVIQEQEVAEFDINSFAGHSLGEYTALTCSGALSFEETLSLVVARADAMQKAVPMGQGGMLVIIGMDDAAVQALCEEVAAGDVLSPANFNAPGQVVVAGAVAAIERLQDVAQSHGAKLVKRIAMSVPSHCQLMQPAVDELKPKIAAIELKQPRAPIVSNVDAQARTEPEAIKQALIEQLCSPVQWTRCIQTQIDLGAQHFLECGPGQVLAGLGKRIARQCQWQGLASVDKLRAITD